LRLITENNQLTRAAVLLFAKDPNKFIRGISCKIGKFGNDTSDLISHDIIECPLFEMPERILELLKTKYLHSIVSYQGIERYETLEYPEKAIRETILNAIIHRNYAYQGTDITIHV
jgi:ATP-dependent DNA helicase RecG